MIVKGLCRCESGSRHWIRSYGMLIESDGKERHNMKEEIFFMRRINAEILKLIE
jgi:hypothetical protein